MTPNSHFNTTVTLGASRAPFQITLRRANAILGTTSMCTVGAAGATSTYQNRSSAHQAAMNHLRYGCLVEHWNQVRSSQALGETRFQPRQTTHFHLLNSFGTVMAEAATAKQGEDHEENHSEQRGPDEEKSDCVPPSDRGECSTPRGCNRLRSARREPGFHQRLTWDSAVLHRGKLPRNREG